MLVRVEVSKTIKKISSRQIIKFKKIGRNLRLIFGKICLKISVRVKFMTNSMSESLIGFRLVMINN